MLKGSLYFFNGRLAWTTFSGILVSGFHRWKNISRPELIEIHCSKDISLNTILFLVGWDGSESFPPKLGGGFIFF